MTRKTLLVLAASRYQIPIITTAKRLGYRVLTIDNVPDNPGHALADQACFIDTTDIQGVLAVARRERVDGVIAACTDVAVPTAAAVAQALDLPGISPDAARITCDKNLFRDFLRDQGWNYPEFQIITTGTVLSETWFAQSRVLKPARSSGSKGVRIISSYAEYRSQVSATLAFSLDHRGILESYIDGSQITCEGLLSQGQVVFAAITDRQTAPTPHVATRGHRLPSRLPASLQAQILDQLAQLWSVLGVTEGPFDCDLVVAGEDIYIIEVSPRVGGNSLARLLLSACGFDLIDYAVRQSMGETVAVPASLSPKPAGLLLLGVEQSGRLHYDVTVLHALAEIPGVEHLAIDYLPGTMVHAFTDGRHRVGEAIVLGLDREEIDQRLAELQTRLALKAIS